MNPNSDFFNPLNAHIFSIYSPVCSCFSPIISSWMSYVFFFTLAYPCSGALDLGEFTQWCGNHWNKPHLDACRSLLQSKSSSPSPLPFPCLYTLLFLNAATMCNVQKPSLSSTTKYYIALPHSILCIFTLLFLLQSRSGLPSYARIRSIAQ